MILYNSTDRDCIRFCFMDLLQCELHEINEMWNTHLIRPDRARKNVSGTPEELFFIPGIRGMASHYYCDTIIIYYNNL